MLGDYDPNSGVDRRSFGAGEDLVDQNSASWNQLDQWLRLVERLWLVA